jgi:HSP90 family molecular chaperone
MGEKRERDKLKNFALPELLSQTTITAALNASNKQQLFAHLDKMRKENPAEYSAFLDAHESDLRDSGYFDK